MSEARRLLGRAKRRVGRSLASSADERGVTAEHWGEEAREKAEGEEWKGLYWQSHPLTQRHINRAIAGGADENWVDFTKRQFFRQRARLALSLGCGYGVLERHALAVDITERFDAFDISPEAVEVARREAEGVGTATGLPTRRRTSTSSSSRRIATTPFLRPRRCITSRLSSNCSTRFETP